MLKEDGQVMPRQPGVGLLGGSQAVALAEGSLAGPSNSDVLIDEKRVSVGVHRDKTGGAGRALVCLLPQMHSLRLELRCRSRTSVKEASF